MKTTLIASIAVLATLAASPAAANGPSIVEEMAEKAIAKGYGATCSLDHRPVKSGGYYPCLDFGPYRYVSGYGKVFGLVVQKDKDPFLVMSGPKGGGAAFLYDGPWNEDMPARMVMWWNETVEGMAAKRAGEEAASAEKKAAEEYIRTLRGEAAEPAPQAAIAEPAPGPKRGTEEISPDIRELLQSR